MTVPLQRENLSCQHTGAIGIKYSPLHKKMYNKKEERQMLELNSGDTPEKLRAEYLDMYEGIHSKISKHY